MTVGVYMVVAGFAIFNFEVSGGMPVEEARTAAVTTIVAIEAFYLFQVRSERTPIWKLGFFSNPYVWIGVPVVALLQLAFIYLPTMNFFFGSAPLPGVVWLRVVLASIPVVLVVGVERAIRDGLVGARTSGTDKAERG